MHHFSFRYHCADSSIYFSPCCIVPLCGFKHVLQSMLYRFILFLTDSSNLDLWSFGLRLIVGSLVFVALSSTSIGLPCLQQRRNGSLRSMYASFRRRVLQVLPQRFFGIKAIEENSASVCNDKVEEAGLFGASASLDSPTLFVADAVPSLKERVLAAHCFFNISKARLFIIPVRSILNSSSVYVLKCSESVESGTPLSLHPFDPGINQLLFAAAFAFLLCHMDHLHYSLRVTSS